MAANNQNNTTSAPVPNQSADKAYYSGRAISTVDNRSALTRRGRVGDPLQTHRDPIHNPSDQNTDKYYRSGGSPESRRGQPSGKIDVPMEPQKMLRNGERVDAVSRRAPGVSYDAEGAGRVAVPITVRSKGEVGEAVAAVFAAIARGEPRVFVQAADLECERRVRAAVDLGVARNQISEERVQDVVIGPMVDGAQLAKQMFGEVKTPDKVEPTEDGQTGNGSDIDDFTAYVKGGDHKDSSAQQAGAVGVSTGEEEDPTVAAARNERGPEGERPRGRLLSAQELNQLGRVNKSVSPSPVVKTPVVAVDPVVAAALAEIPPVTPRVPVDPADDTDD